MAGSLSYSHNRKEHAMPDPIEQDDKIDAFAYVAEKSQQKRKRWSWKRFWKGFREDLRNGVRYSFEQRLTFVEFIFVLVLASYIEKDQWLAAILTVIIGCTVNILGRILFNAEKHELVLALKRYSRSLENKRRRDKSRLAARDKRQHTRH